MFGFQLFDKVLFKNQTGFVFGRRASGYFDIRNLLGEKLSTGISYKKLHRVEARKSLLVELFPLTPTILSGGFHQIAYTRKK